MHPNPMTKAWIGVLALVSLTAWIGPAAAQSQEQDLVDSANATFESFMRDPNMTWLQQHVGAAHGILIAPQIFRAGFIFGGAGGRAVQIGRAHV